MKRCMTIDRGNSVMKLTVWGPGSAAIAVCASATFTPQQVATFAGEHGPIHRAIYCSTTGYDPALIAALDAIGITTITLNYLTPMPLQLRYSTPDTLGPDRIAAAAGAVSLWPGRDVLVVDAGTAVTYDRVTADGAFAGGAIAPGVKMRLDALHAFTAVLPQLDPAECPSAGIDTASAMRLGAWAGVIAEIRYYAALLPSDAIVALTGGDAPQLAPLLASHGTTTAVHVEPNLVNIGLLSILNYNEAN